MAAGAIDEKVQALVEQHRPELERLVDQAVEAELERLVDERIAARNGNGNGHERGSEPRTLSPSPTLGPEAVKVCVACQRTLPVGKFEKARSKCRECRREEYRARSSRPEQPDQEPPRTASGI